MFLISEDPVMAGTTPKLTATIRNHSGTALTLASLDTLLLTFWDDATGIKLRDQQDVKNANNFTVHATSGLVSGTFQVVDTTLVSPDPNVPREIRKLYFEWTWTETATTYYAKSDVGYFYVNNPRAGLA